MNPQFLSRHLNMPWEWKGGSSVDESVRVSKIPYEYDPRESTSWNRKTFGHSGLAELGHPLEATEPIEAHDARDDGHLEGAAQWELTQRGSTQGNPKGSETLNPIIPKP